MRLSAEEVARYRTDGYLLFDKLLSGREVAALRGELPGLYARSGPEVVREKQSDAIRLVYGAHAYSPPYGCLSRLPRLLEPVQQLLEDDVYIHQSRLNPKQGFTGGGWSWHQDFGTWHREDGLPEPRCVMVAVFLHDATAVNGALMVVPRSQTYGLIADTSPEADAKGYTVMEIDQSALTEMADVNGIVPLLGKAGTVAFIHCNLVHGSAPNVSPWPRAIMYLNYSAVSNGPTLGRRAWHHDNQDRAPLAPISDDALAELAENVAE